MSNVIIHARVLGGGKARITRRERKWYHVHTNMRNHSRAILMTRKTWSLQLYLHDCYTYLHCAENHTTACGTICSVAKLPGPMVVAPVFCLLRSDFHFYNNQRVVQTHLDRLNDIMLIFYQLNPKYFEHMARLILLRPCIITLQYLRV